MRFFLLPKPLFLSESSMLQSTFSLSALSESSSQIFSSRLRRCFPLDFVIPPCLERFLFEPFVAVESIREGQATKESSKASLVLLRVFERENSRSQFSAFCLLKSAWLRLVLALRQFSKPLSTFPASLVSSMQQVSSSKIWLSRSAMSLRSCSRASILSFGFINFRCVQIIFRLDCQIGGITEIQGQLLIQHSFYMLNPFAMEKAILDKLLRFQAIAESIKREISVMLLQKSKDLQIELTQDLQEKCEVYLAGSQNSKLYMCRVCHKKFDDGRKLGGHVSRAHKGIELDLEIEENGGRGRKRVKLSCKEQGSVGSHTEENFDNYGLYRRPSIYEEE